MFTCHYYFVTEPLQEEYTDDSDHPPQHTITVPDRREVTLSFFGNEVTISMMRISLSGLCEKSLSSDNLEVLQLVKEHAWTLLRLTYDKDLTLYPLSMWSYQEHDKPYRLSVNMKTMLAKSDPPYNVIEAAFSRGLALRMELRLFVDALDLRLPLQFRYLSLYKIIELIFKTGRKWRPSYRLSLVQFEAEYRASNVSPKPLFSYINDLRDRCAHVKTNGGMFGVTMLSSRAAAEVERMLPMMMRICSTLLNARGFGIVLLQTSQLACVFDPAARETTTHTVQGSYSLGVLAPSSVESIERTAKAE
jgi:hypothetical protein